MKAEVRVTGNFRKEAKPLLKKFPSLKNDLLELNTALLKTPALGTPLGNNAYKIRLAIKSKGKGKSGGARVITYLETEIIAFAESADKEKVVVNLISIYDKSEVDTISPKELKSLIEGIEY